MTADRIPEAWRSFLGERLDQNQLDRILEQLEEERRSCVVFPPEGKVFHALALTPPDAVRVVLIGQDPYHEEGQAEGLAFSVPEGVKFPPSLRNIFKEFADDLGGTVPDSGSLHAWAKFYARVARSKEGPTSFVSRARYKNEHFLVEWSARKRRCDPICPTKPCRARDWRHVRSLKDGLTDKTAVYSRPFFAYFCQSLFFQLESAHFCNRRRKRTSARTRWAGMARPT